MMAGRRPRANLIFSGHVSMSLFRRMARMPLLHDRHRRNPSASPWTYTFENAPRGSCWDPQSMQEILSKACICRGVRYSRLQNPPAHTGDSQGGRKPLREVKAAELSGDVTRCKDHAVLLPLQHRAAH